MIIIVSVSSIRSKLLHSPRSDMLIFSTATVITNTSEFFIILRGDKPFTTLTPYFEVTIKAQSEPAYPFIGLAITSIDAKGPAGYGEIAYAYDGFLGFLYRATSIGTTYGEPYGAGDTIGCGLDPHLAAIDNRIRAVFWTKNGRHCGAVAISVYDEIFPIMMMRHAKMQFEVNWGEREFMWKGEKWDGVKSTKGVE
jgi:hypothetical protein